MGVVYRLLVEVVLFVDVIGVAGKSSAAAILVKATGYDNIMYCKDQGQ